MVMIVAVRKGLYIGDSSAPNEANVRGVVNVTSEVPPSQKATYFYRIAVSAAESDVDRIDIMQRALVNIIPAIEHMMRNGFEVLVHSAEGKQRSCAVVVAYLMYAENLNLEKAILSLKASYPHAFEGGKIQFIESLRCYHRQLQRR